MPARQHDADGARTVAISDAVVKILHDYTGRGPTKARTTIAEQGVFVVLGDTLTAAERRLADNGRESLVLATRREFQELMRADLVAAVEAELDREVVAFMSQNHIAPDIAVEIFVLAPRGEGRDGD